MEGEQGRKIVRSSTESLTRLAQTKAEVSSSVDPSTVSLHADRLTKPKSMAGTMRKAGIALIATPDPITGVPGVALVATSFMLKKNEPTNLGHLASETRKILRDIQSLSL